jgi:hypothetical protein
VHRIQRYLDAFESRSIPDGDVVPGLPAPWDAMASWRKHYTNLY